MVYKWAQGDLKLPLGVIELVTCSPPFYLARFTLKTLVFIAKQQAVFLHTDITSLTSPELHFYTHERIHQIKAFMKKIRMFSNEPCKTWEKKIPTFVRRSFTNTKGWSNTTLAFHLPKPTFHHWNAWLCHRNNERATIGNQKKQIWHDKHLHNS